MAGRNPAPSAADKPLSLIEQARRTQLIQVTIGLVAEHGHAATSLTRIAQAAGITKGAVLYHFSSKNAVVTAAREHVLGELASDVGSAVDSAAPQQAPAAYVRRMVGHMTENPQHARMLIEAMSNDDRPEPASRWRPLAELLQKAREAKDLAPGPDTRTLAIITGGAIDGIITEHLRDPGYDAKAAAENLVTMLETAILA